MRNLKKILALVLALVMSLSLMATASAADASAAGTDKYTTAKDVLEKLEVFRGDEGGMRYDASITRAETAALVYRIATADVKDTQRDLYTNNPFTDLGSAAWANGYISYGYNAEILKGNGDNTFTPNAPVTGYATLAMILRTMGYGKNHEFEGESWEIQTAATARQVGLLNGVTAADEATLGQAAPRGLVAQILFNALLQPTVKFNINTPYNYAPDAETLGKQKFGLEEIEGVVTANEYADLYANTTLAANKTRLNVNGVDYLLNETKTTLDDIGESKLAYVRTVGNQPAKTVLVIADSGRNTVSETPDEKRVDALLSDASLSRNAETESYINFSKDFRWQSDWRIRYEINFLSTSADRDAAEREYENERLSTGWTVSLKDFQSYINNNPTTVNVSVNGSDTVVMYRWTYQAAFQPDAVISAGHQTNIKTIFDTADRFTEVNVSRDAYTYGEVYVGTSSLKDVSDTMSYKQFVETYINQDTEAGVSGNEKGNWLKVIDNDADGIADYILKVVYTTAQVEAVKDGSATLDVAVRSTRINDGDEINQLTSQPVVSDDELTAGDVVYYAVIDGKAQTYKATPVTAKINRVNRNDRVATADDDTKYAEAGVHEHIYNPDYAKDVREMAGGVSYDMYLGRGDYLLAFVKTAATSFTLITDGYYNSSRNGDEYAVKAYIDGKQVNTDVSRNGVMFIDRNAAGVQNNGWNAIRELGQPTNSLNAKGAVLKTTVAGLDADGNLIPVDYSSVYERGSHAMIAFRKQATSAVQEERYNSIVGNSYATGTAYTTNGVGNAVAYNSNDGEVEIRALSSTIYYFVYRDNRGEIQVAQYNGYASVPSLSAAEMAKIEDIYAVGTLTERVSTGTDRERAYYTANVVVVEFSQPYKQYGEQILVVDDPVVASSIQIDNVKVIRSSGAAEEIDIDMTSSWIRTYDKAGRKCVQPGLYNLYPTSTDGLYTISSLDHDEIAGYNFDAGQISTALGTVNYDYAEVNSMVWNNAADTYGPGSHNEYKLTADTRYYTLSYSGTGIDAKASLTESALASVLDPRVDESELKAKVEFVYDLERDPNSLPDNRYYRYGNRNDVLVAYDGAGNAIYVVSFANIGDSAANGAGGHVSYSNYAQNVWEYVMPSAVAHSTNAPAVELRSQNAANLHEVVADLNGVYTTRTGNTFNTVIPYSVWSKYAGDEAILYFTPAANNQISVSGTTTFRYESFPVNAEAIPVFNIANDVTVGPITVMSQADGGTTEAYFYNYTFTAPNHNSAFTNVPAGTAVTKDSVLNNGSRYVNLEAFVLAFGTPKGATAVWSFTTEGGENFTITVKNPVDGSAAVTENNAPRDVDILDEVADSFTVTVTAECGETEHTTTYTSTATPPDPSGNVTVTVNFVVGGETVYSIPLTKAIVNGAITLDWTNDVVLNGWANINEIQSVTASNGQTCTQSGFDWVIPAGADETALTVTVSYDTENETPGPGPGLLPPLSKGGRTLSMTSMLYGVWAPEGKRPESVTVNRPTDGTFVVGDLSKSIIYPGATPPAGCELVAFPVTVEETLTNADIFVIVNSWVDLEEEKPDVPVPGEDELLPYRAELDGGTYKFYGYGDEYAELSEDEMKTAMAKVLSARDKVTLTKEDIKISPDGKTVYYTRNNKDFPAAITSGELTSGSWKNTIEQWAVSYKGEVVTYAAHNESVDVENLDGNYIVVDSGENGAYDDPTSVVDGKASFTMSADKDVSLVDVIKVSVDATSILAWNYKKVDGTWTNGASGKSGWVKTGTEVQAVTPNSSTTYTSGALYQVRNGMLSLKDLTAKDLEGANYMRIDLGALTADKAVDDVVALSLDQVYNVTLSGADIGKYAKDDDIPVAAYGLAEDDVVIALNNRTPDATAINCSGVARVGQTSNQYMAWKAVGADDETDEAVLSLDENLVGRAVENKINLSSTSMVTVPAGVTVVVTYAGESSAELTLDTTYYVAQNASLKLTSSKNETIFSVTVGENDPVLVGTPDSSAATTETITIGSEEVEITEVLAPAAAMIHISSNDKKIDGNSTIAGTSVGLAKNDKGGDTTQGGVLYAAGKTGEISVVKTTSRPSANWEVDTTYIITVTNLEAEDGITLEKLDVGKFVLMPVNCPGWTIDDASIRFETDGTATLTLRVTTPESF